MRSYGWGFFALLGSGLLIAGVPGQLTAAAGVSRSGPAATPDVRDASAAGSTRRLWHDGKRVLLRDAPDVPIPSFSRQTKLPCTACHTTFPQLTAFGRLFKLNGYTLAGIEQIRATLPDTMLPPTLALDVIPPLSVMAQASLTHVAEELPGTQNDEAEFPQELSLFVGEAITPQ